MGLLREAVETARHAGAVVDRPTEEAGARRARDHGRRQRIQRRALEGSRPAGRADISGRRRADRLGADRNICDRTASQCGALVPGMAAHPRNPAILHRFHGAVFGSRAGAIEAGTPEDFRHQADEGRPRRRRENGGRDQDALCAAVSGVGLAWRRITLYRRSGTRIFAQARNPYSRWWLMVWTAPYGIAMCQNEVVANLRQGSRP